MHVLTLLLDPPLRFANRQSSITISIYYSSIIEIAFPLFVNLVSIKSVY
jgi:hypothetical protein